MTTSNPIQSSTDLFRRLTWQASILLSIRLADNIPTAGIDRYYVSSPIVGLYDKLMVDTSTSVYLLTAADP